MGAWGYEPQDNDTAADWFGSAMDKSKLPARIEKGLRSKYKEEVRAAAYLLEQIGRTYVYDIEVIDKHLALAIEKLDGILRDKAWIEDWKDSSAIRRSIRRQIKGLKGRLGESEHPETKKILKDLERKLAEK